VVLSNAGLSGALLRLNAANIGGFASYRRSVSSSQHGCHYRTILIKRLMLRTRNKRQANQAEYARKRLALIEAAIIALGDEDLLDLADIFKSEPHMPLAESALAELSRRNLSV